MLNSTLTGTEVLTEKPGSVTLGVPLISPAMPPASTSSAPDPSVTETLKPAGPNERLVSSKPMLTTLV